MNFEILTTDELIKYAQPITILERKLLDSLVDVNSELKSVSKELSELENMESYESAYDEIRFNISQAIKLLQDGDKEKALQIMDGCV